jgi:tRNA threonylcarbamoyladenosine biosynthesis protein TsaE
MKQEFTTHSAEETADVAYALGQEATAGTVFALHGELGSGKTVIAKAIARGMGITDDITSPTFALLEEYQGELPLYHFDLYRIENEDELDLLYFDDYWEGNGVSIIEWAERADTRLPETTIHITITYLEENKRSITIEYPDN